MKHKTDANFRELVKQADSLPISVGQLQFIRNLMEQKNVSVSDIIMDGFPPLEKLNRGLASELLEYLMDHKEKTFQYRDSGGMERLGELL